MHVPDWIEPRKGRRGVPGRSETKTGPRNHLRNVRGRVPNFVEVFVDEGDTDILRILRILHRAGYDGLITPDHAPAMNCPAPGHAAMAFQLGYLKALMKVVMSE